MKKILFKISLLIAIMGFVAVSANAQLPLLQGDAVATHSSTNNSGPGTAIVLRVVKTNNTTTAPLGINWNTATMTTPGSGNKPPNWNAANWTQSVLGNIFGITLDDQSNPNIYVSSTQIYSGSYVNASKVWRLDGVTGANSLVYNFPNANRSLGNLKYFKAGSTENIYVTNWDNGVIERLNGNSGSTALWAIQTAFNPKFGLAVDNARYVPYGLAVRTISGGVYRLYYARISTTAPFNTNEIWSVDLNAGGDFIASTEQQEVFPITALSAYTGTVISDIAFTNDGKKMLVGQQTFAAFGILCAHRANIGEFEVKPVDHNWSASANLFHPGQQTNFSSSCGGSPTDWNAVGGVSYSNNVLQGDQNAVSCNGSAWFTSDAIVIGLATVYGIQGMNGNGGASNAVGNSIIIDEDDYALNGDKIQLGDIEVYKKPMNCTPCGCGSWKGNPTINDVAIPGVNEIYDGPKVLAPKGDGTVTITTKKGPATIISKGSSLPPLPVVQIIYPIQFVKGNVSGLINATYQCTGDCGATYTWLLTNSAGTTIANGAALPVDLSKFNTIAECGKYKLVIKAKCGDSNCGSLTIPITIICEPPVNCCKASIDIDLKTTTVHAVTNLPDPTAFSTANFIYNMQFSLPMSEVRVSVEEFRLSSTSPNCLNCSNRPVTWGNILSADINGTPLALTGLSGLPTGSVQADYREAVYNTGTPLMPSAAGLRIKLSLPAITELSCCEVYAYVCLKFTFKDTQCRECVQMVCGKILLVAPKDAGGPRTDKIDVKKFKVQH